MKAKEIIAQIQSQNGVQNKKQKEFFAILIKELNDIYQSFGNKDSERHFDAAVKTLYSKWASISKQIKTGLTDGLWNFFYATEIVKLKTELCPSWAERKRIEREKYEERRMKREAKREAWIKAYGFDPDDL